MAQYDVNYSCGHSGTVSLVGKVTERERKIEWLKESGDCPDCYRAAQQKKAEEETKKMGLPPLTGTEKQIAWADKIRIEKIKMLESEMTSSMKTFEKMGKHEAFEKVRKAVEEKGLSAAESEKYFKNLEDVFKKVELLNNFKSTTSASWIIDRR